MSNIPKSERQKYIGASEVAAIFGLSPHLTHFELWHRKAGNIEDPNLEEGDERVHWGNLLERAIGVGVSEKTGWQVHKVHRYIIHKSVKGMGASPDFEVINHAKGPGVLETKTVDWLVFQDWPDHRPPIHYQLQLQHQLAVTGRQWGAIAALIGGNELEVFEYQRHEPSIRKIEKGVTEFWHSIHEEREPKPDFAADADTISLLYRSSFGEVEDMRGDNYLADLCARYHIAAQSEKEAKEKRKAIRAEILTKIGHAPAVLVDGYRISATEVPDKEMPPHMRRGYRNVTINAMKEAAE